MAEGDVFINGKKSEFDFTIPDPDVITFECQKVILKPKEVITDWPDGMPLPFAEYQRLVFTDGKTRVTYSKIRVEKI